MTSGKEVVLLQQAQRLLRDHVADFSGVLAAPPDASRYERLCAQNPLWSRARLVKTATKKPINQAARLGGAAGGVAFMPGIGTGLALTAVVGSTLQLLSSCVEAIDTVARSHDFDQSDEGLRTVARLCVLDSTIAARARPSFSLLLPSTAAELVRCDAQTRTALLEHSSEIVQHWGLAVASWRLTAAVPFGFGALAGVYASYLPIRLSIRSAELFFAKAPDQELVDVSEKWQG